MQFPPFASGLLVALLAIGGCHPAKAPQATAQDIDAAKQDAARELTQARMEASKDIKSAAKVAGANSKEVALAKVTADYDISMAKAEGDHKIAAEKCTTLQAPRVKPCQDQADADYEAARTNAKVARVARKQ